jgi:two-component system, chemotaxis family, sensor kinase CheA
MLGYAAIRDYIHLLEEGFRDPPAEWPQSLLDMAFEGAAALRRAVGRLGTDGEEAALTRLAALPPLDSGGITDAPPASYGEPPPDAPPPSADAGQDAESADVAGGGGEMLRIPLERLDALANHVAELLGAHAVLDEFLTVHRDALDSADLRRPLQRIIEQSERISGNLRDAATSLRLVPVGRVLRRFPSLARDLAREQGKRVRVELEGEETELDKSTVDILGEPLLHLVRNAVDHGIRTPEEREAIGKPPEGTIRLRATQMGDTVRIVVEDDGEGLDRESILRSARAAGLVAPGEQPDDGAIGELIFRPGFSTRTEADTVSGRGIGMDVVASSVARLRGNLEVEHQRGVGTRFVLQLPLTVAILPVLLFEAAGETLALPALDVEDIQRTSGTMRVADSEVVTRGDEVVPVARLERVLGLDRAAGRAGRSPGTAASRYVLVVRRGSRAVGVMVDRIVDQRDVVVKGLPSYLGQPHGVSGATVGPDGRVVLLLDAVELIDLNLQAHRRRTRGE